MAIFLAHLTKDPMINVRPQLIFYATAERFKQFCCNGFSVYRGVKGTVSKRFPLLQDESTEWWQVHTDLIELLFLINQLRSYFRIVNITGSPVFLFIAVENFFCKCLAGNISLAPGCVHMYVYMSRRLANFLHSSPGILYSIGLLPCTTSSWLNGSMKFSS